MRATFSSSLAVLATSASLSLASPYPNHLGRRQDGVPSVDLGYEIHTATINETGDYYLFSNIPYADQPIGDLRFQKVSLPTGNSSTVNNGSTEIICYQSEPEWIYAIEAASYGITVEEVEEILYTEAGQTEACLVLDAYVPAGVFDGNSTSKAPVLFWIHGGGFVGGSKTSAGLPPGLIARSNLNGNEGIIVISINYRLGLFGWLSEGGITPNLGLYDQLVALDWVQEYIHLFGGDPDRVTVIGESAGAASIFHHITSYGGDTTLPFQQAIIQSPAFQFTLNQTDAYVRTLAEASSLTGTNITSIADLAALDTETLFNVNFYTTLGSAQGFFTYGPSVDGTYVPNLPQILLTEGKFNHDIKVLPAHNSEEAVPFVSTSITTEAELIAEVESVYPQLSNETLNAILDLYPLSTYGSQFLRGVQIATDSFFACTTRYLGLAYGNETYNYIFAYPPGYHGEDTSYTFFNGDTSTLDDGYPVDPTVAYALQDYIVGFTISGNPNDSPAGAAVEFPTYGSNGSVIEFTSSGAIVTIDDMVNDRCPWWLEALTQGLV